MNDSSIERKLKVSIIIPVYNAEQYLRKCIESILNQELQQFELILVDDGSTDNSLSICQSYKQKDERVQVIHQINQGVSVARNTGIKVAKGEFIAFVDADDWIEAAMYEEMYAQAIKYEAEAVVCNYVEEWPNQRLLKKHHINKPVIDTQAEKEQLVLNLIAGKYLNDLDNMTAFRGSCFYLYKRENLQEQGYLFEEELPIGEDFVFNLNILPTLKHIAAVEGSYYHYHINEASTTQKYRKNCYEEQKILIQSVERTLISHNLKEQAKEKLEVMKLTYLVTRVVNECHKDNKKSYKEKIKAIKDMCSEASMQRLLKQFDDTQFTRGRKLWFSMYRKQRATILYSYYRLKAKLSKKGAIE